MQVLSFTQSIFSSFSSLLFYFLLFCSSSFSSPFFFFSFLFSSLSLSLIVSCLFSHCCYWHFTGFEMNNAVRSVVMIFSDLFTFLACKPNWNVLRLYSIIRHLIIWHLIFWYFWTFINSKEHIVNGSEKYN